MLSVLSLFLSSYRCHKWILNCKRQDLLSKWGKVPLEHFNRSYSLCRDHFEECYFTNSYKNTLADDAVPTIFDVPNPHLPTVPLSATTPAETEPSSGKTNVLSFAWTDLVLGLDTQNYLRCCNWNRSSEKLSD